MSSSAIFDLRTKSQLALMAVETNSPHAVAHVTDFIQSAIALLTTQHDELIELRAGARNLIELIADCQTLTNNALQHGTVDAIQGIKKANNVSPDYDDGYNYGAMLAEKHLPKTR